MVLNERQRAVRRAYYYKNKAKVLALVKKYQAANKDKIKKRRDEHYRKNIEAIRAAGRARYNDPEKRKILRKRAKKYYYSEASKEKRRIYQKNNRKKMTERFNKWRKANPERNRQTLQRFWDKHRDRLNEQQRVRKRKRHYGEFHEATVLLRFLQDNIKTIKGIKNEKNKSAFKRLKCSRIKNGTLEYAYGASGKPDQTKLCKRNRRAVSRADASSKN